MAHAVHADEWELLSLCPFFYSSPPPPPSPRRVKLEKERREKSRQLGLIRTEGSDGGEDMERERRIFQLQMCEVGNQCQSKYHNPYAKDTFCIPEGGSIYIMWVVCQFYSWWTGGHSLLCVSSHLRLKHEHSDCEGGGVQW